MRRWIRPFGPIFFLPLLFGTLSPTPHAHEGHCEEEGNPSAESCQFCLCAGSPGILVDLVPVLTAPEIDRAPPLARVHRPFSSAYSPATPERAPPHDS